MALLELKNISKKYATGDESFFALENVSLEIEEGEFVAIMGPSGSGKSTLSNVIGLLDQPTSGNYLLRGHEVSKKAEDEMALLRRNEIGFVFQQFHLLSRLSAVENVALPLLYSLRQTSLEPAQKMLKQVGLENRAHHRPNQMSGGQQQRVAIARALINQPRIILADEPTGNLDSKTQIEIMSFLSQLNEQGITIIMVTHEDDVARYANRIVRLKDGQIVSDEKKQIHSKAHSFSKAPSPIPKTPDFITKIKGIFQHLIQGVRVLKANRVRTALSMLGILIGVGAVVTMMALGQGAQSAIEAQLSALGSNLLVVRRGYSRLGGQFRDSINNRLRFEDYEAIRTGHPLVKDATPTIDDRAQVGFLNRISDTTAYGVRPSYQQMRNIELEVGRFFSEEEDQARALVVVLGAEVAKKLFFDRNPLGEWVRINRVAFQVIGVAKAKGGSGWRNQDDQVVVPVQTAMKRLFGQDFLDTIDIEVNDKENVNKVQEWVTQFLNERKKIPLARQEDSFLVMNMAEIQSAMSETSKTLSTLLASIAAISLIVGGIGIMNIMLVSVAERTKEIGLRKAVGAQKKDILTQFLTEAIVVSFGGGLLGVLLAVIATSLMTWLSGWTATISLSSVLLAFFFSVITGVVFGLYPAQKASRLTPIEALRYD